MSEGKCIAIKKTLVMFKASDAYMVGAGTC